MHATLNITKPQKPVHAAFSVVCIFLRMLSFLVVVVVVSGWKKGFM